MIRAWYVWCPDYGEEWWDARIVHAIDAESAAEEWAEHSDAEGDYNIAKGGAPEIHVWAEGGDAMVLTVRAETSIVYSVVYHADMSTEETK
jgi:hypothetical protein